MHTHRNSVEPLSVDSCLSGGAIYGDDFNIEEINAWYQDEKEGYANLYESQEAKHKAYPYHAQNRLYGYSTLPRAIRFRHALGFGAAFGEELLPVIDRIDRVTIVDPSDHFVRSDVGGKPAEWVRPVPSGDLPFASDEFDLITCFGVIHHIPNASYVIKELGRVLAPGGFLVIREPVISMGDWRQKRHGLTSRERGLPLVPYERAIADAGMRIQRRTLCMFPPFVRLCLKVGITPLGNPVAVRIDQLISAAVSWNYRYHASTLLQKIRPTNAFMVLTK